MALLRIPFLLSATIAMNIAGTSPNPPPENTERLAPTGFESVFAMTIPWAPHAGKVSSMLTFFHNFRTAHLLE